MSHVKLSGHVGLALLTLSTACAGDESEPRYLPPVGMFEAGVMVPDSGFPTPVLTPPPSSLQNDAGTDAMVARPPFGFDAGRADASVRETGVPASSDGAAQPPSDDPAASNPCGTGAEPLAANIRVSELSMYQTVKVPLFKTNAWVTTRNAALVQGKKALVRAFVEPQTGFAARSLRGVLTFDTDGRKAIYTSERMITRASTDDAADSTFSFQVDGTSIGASTQISVSVLETTCVPAGENSAGARLPATGGQALSADAIGKFRVVVVPVTLAGRTPDTSEAQLEKFRSELLALYPVAEVEVTAHAAVSYSGTVQPAGSGWSEVLSLVGRTRQQDAPATSVYYFGLITPAATFRDYCRSGCVAGLAPQTTIVSRANQIGLGVGYIDASTASTMAHELGHAHGLPHAPCTRGGSIDGADTRFPYAGAKIGSWGWDSRSNKLLSPATYVDLMSYCEPTWFSDFYYAKVATRAKAVNTAAFIYNSDKLTHWTGLILHPDGTAQWSGMTSDELPGEPSPARALDSQGRLVSEIEVVRVPLSHSADTFLYVPAPAASWASVDLGDRVLKLAEIASAHD